MNRLITNEEGYTLVESVVAMALFVTVVLALLESVNYLIVTSGRNELAEASRIAQTEIAGVSADSLYPKRADSGRFLVERSISRLGGCAEITICVSSSANQDRKLVTITRLVPVQNER